MNRTKYLYRLFIDSIFIIICFFAAKYVSGSINSFAPIRNSYLLIYILVFWYFASQVTFLYNDFLSRSLSQEIITVTKTIFIQITFFVFALFFLSKSPLDAKWYALSLFVLELLILPLVKYFSRWYYSERLNNGKNAAYLLIVGVSQAGMIFSEYILNNHQIGYKIVGFLDDNIKPEFSQSYLGKIDQLNTILQREEIHEVVIALPNPSIEITNSVVKISQDNGKRVKIIPDYYSFSSPVSIANFGSIPVISLRAIPLDSVELRFFKRLFDIIFSLFTFILIFSWLFPILAILIKLSSEGPVFFIQERWGINNKKIYCYKFRSMVTESCNTDVQKEYQQASKNDSRITSIGKILRKTNLDELPQFINVLKGEMSIVGPRPHPTPLNIKSKDSIDNYLMRHLIKPGITGWAQVNGYRGETKENLLMQKRVDYDIWYIENWSFWLDCQIILQTVINMIKGDKNAY